LKSLGREIDDFSESCVFKSLISVSFRLFSQLRTPGRKAALPKSGFGPPSIIAFNSENGKSLLAACGVVSSQLMQSCQPKFGPDESWSTWAQFVLPGPSEGRGGKIGPSAGLAGTRGPVGADRN